MSKPASMVLGVLGVIAVAVVLGAFALRDKQPGPSPIEEHETVATTPPAPSSHAAPPKPPSLPPPAPSPLAAPKHRQATGKDAGAILDEASLMAKLHELGVSNLPLSLQLAREGVARFSGSPNAPEFEWNVVKSMAAMGRSKEAQEEARVMVKKYPGTSWTADVQRHVLSNPEIPPTGR
jgi:type IV secretory pathway VirB10-like protein